MSWLQPIKPGKKPRIGLYSIGLKAYWEQFPGLRDRLIEYGHFIEKHMSSWGEVYNYGLVDTEGEGRQAGEWLNRQHVDIVFLSLRYLFDQLYRAAGASNLQSAGRFFEPAADGADSIRFIYDR